MYARNNQIMTLLETSLGNPTVVKLICILITYLYSIGGRSSIITQNYDVWFRYMLLTIWANVNDDLGKCVKYLQNLILQKPNTTSGLQAKGYKFLLWGYIASKVGVPILYGF